MPKTLQADLNDRLLAAIARHEEGATMAQIEVGLGDAPSRRTLQRRLTHLMGRGRIVAQGNGPATRYRTNVTPSASPAAAPPREAYVPVSPEGEQVSTWVRLPIMRRVPVGYVRHFLESYRPNETWYLSDPARRQWLHDMGMDALGVRPAGTYARETLGRLLIDLSWASSQLEGNTYTRLDTQRLIEHGQEAEGKAQAETQMILNHKQAIEFLVDESDEIGLNLHTFMNLHALLSENLLRDPAAGGRLRARAVDIAGTVFRPLAIPQQIDELFRMILDKAAAIRDPFEQAFFQMVHIPYLQPFEDVNKRVSRLAANIPLIKAGLCPLSFVEVPERAYVEGLLGVHERNRIELLRDVFLWAYERSCQQFRAIASGLPEPDPFRLKYRAALGEVVAEIVRQGLAPKEAPVRNLTHTLVPPADLDRFVQLALDELGHLHEGNIARYRLRLSEFRAWRSTQGD